MIDLNDKAQALADATAEIACSMEEAWPIKPQLKKLIKAAPTTELGRDAFYATARRHGLDEATISTVLAQVLRS